MSTMREVSRDVAKSRCKKNKCKWLINTNAFPLLYTYQLRHRDKQCESGNRCCHLLRFPQIIILITEINTLHHVYHWPLLKYLFPMLSSKLLKELDAWKFMATDSWQLLARCPDLLWLDQVTHLTNNLTTHFNWESYFFFLICRILFWWAWSLFTLCLPMHTVLGPGQNSSASITSLSFSDLKCVPIICRKVIPVCVHQPRISLWVLYDAFIQRLCVGRGWVIRWWLLKPICNFTANEIDRICIQQWARQDSYLGR